MVAKTPLGSVRVSVSSVVAMGVPPTLRNTHPAGGEPPTAAEGEDSGSIQKVNKKHHTTPHHNNKREN
jgi:hypothetical protein